MRRRLRSGCEKISFAGPPSVSEEAVQSIGVRISPGSKELDVMFSWGALGRPNLGECRSPPRRSILNLVCLAVLGSRLPSQDGKASRGGRESGVVGPKATPRSHRERIWAGGGGRGGGSKSRRVCRGPTPRPSWRPSAVAVQEHSDPRSSECIATAGLGVPRGFLSTAQFRRRLD